MSDQVHLGTRGYGNVEQQIEHYLILQRRPAAAEYLKHVPRILSQGVLVIGGNAARVGLGGDFPCGTQDAKICMQI